MHMVIVILMKVRELYLDIIDNLMDIDDATAIQSQLDSSFSTR